jgi:hypothetical protein
MWSHFIGGTVLLTRKESVLDLVGKHSSDLGSDSLKNLFIKNCESGVLKCEELGLELDHRFYNIFFKILEPQPGVLSQKKNCKLGTRPRGSLEN